MEEINYWTSYVIPIGTQLVIAVTAIYAVRKQVINSGITQFRQQWIDNLRNTISEFCSITKNIILLWNQYDKHNKETEAIYKDFEMMVFKIKLLINPNEEDHKMLVTLVEEINQDLYDPLFVPKKIDTLLRSLVSCSQGILKREWEVVKKGK